MKLAWSGVGVSLAVAGLKFAAWWSTGSVALYSDALECVINVVGACTALAALWISLRPADASHPYGYQKVEHVSAMVEGLMVLAAAAAILHEVYIGPGRSSRTAMVRATTTGKPSHPAR